MKIKQTTKIIILVVALVSVIGVGAVSFALWNGGATTVTASASVGELTVYGWASEGWTSTLNQKKLVPNDQPGTLPEDCAKVISTALPVITPSEDGAYTYTIEIAIASLSKTLATGSKFLVKVGAQATDTTGEGWFELVAQGDKVTFDVAEDYLNGTDAAYLNVQLVSNETADMNITVNFTATLVATEIAA